MSCEQPEWVISGVRLRDWIEKQRRPAETISDEGYDEALAHLTEWLDDLQAASQVQALCLRQEQLERHDHELRSR